MKNYSMVILFTCMSLMMGACGKKSSTNLDENQNKEMCSDGFESYPCDDIISDADRDGFLDTFRGVGSDCECLPDEHKIIYRGLIRCEKEIRPKAIKVREVGVYIRKRKNGRKSMWVNFNTTNINVFDGQTGISSRDVNCNPENDGYSISCESDRDCEGWNDFMSGSMFSNTYCRKERGSSRGACSR